MTVQRQSPFKFAIEGDLRRLAAFIRSFRAHMTPARLGNFVKAEMELLLGKSVLHSYPYFLKIEPTNRCNLRCPLCPQITGYCQMKSPGPPHYGMLPFDLYTKVVDELQPYLFRILLYGQGEPFLAGDIFEMIRYASEKNIGVAISTNFNIARDGLADEIVRSGLEHLEVSLDGTDQRAYAEFRVGGQFDLVRDNIARVVQAKKKLRSKTPCIEWQFIVMRHNEHQIGEARRMARELGVDYLTFTPVSNIDVSRKDLVEKWVATNPKYRQYDPTAGTNVRTMRRRRVCSWLYRSAVINCDGSVSPCCYFPNFPQACFGNLRDSNFKAIWNSALYTNAREAISSDKLKELGGKAGICSICRSSEANQT